MPMIIPVPSGGQDMTPYIIGPFHGAAITAWLVANTGIYVHFRVARPRLVTGIMVGVGAASGNGKAGLYQSDGTTLTNIGLSASIAFSAANSSQSFAFSAAVDIFPGIDYYGFLAVDNTVVTINRATVGAAGIASTLGISYVQSTQFVTPPPTILFSTLTGGSGAATGSSPVLALY